MLHWRRSIGALVKAAAAAFLVAGCAGATAPVASTPALAGTTGVYPEKYAAIVVDASNGNVLYSANADSRRYPASLTKMMTLYVLFEDLERGRYRLNSRLSVSANAAAQAPSKLGLRAGDTIMVEDAIKALVTKSANDAAATIGENLAGSVPAFAERMTRTARALGMNSTRFRNASGLPDPGQYTTARDMMKLGVALQVRFPAYYAYFQTRSFTFRGRTMGNHNNLLGRIEGVDGIKTGYINASGFNLVSSVKRDGRRLVAVVMGGRTARSRDAHMARLIEAYLPRAVRGRGFDDELVAQVRAAPKVAASEPAPAILAQAPDGIDHPQPSPRPVVIDSETVTPEIVTASVATVPARGTAIVQPRAVHTEVMPVPVAAPEPAILAHSSVPNSAGEAFADIALSSAERDVLGTMIETTVGEGDAEEVQVASLDSDIAPAPKSGRTAPVQAAVAPAAKARALETPVRDASETAQSGWIVQIGAVASKDAANDLLRRAQRKVGGPLAEAAPVTEIFSKGSQTFVRARFAGFETEREASRACAALKRNAFNCYTQRL